MLKLNLGCGQIRPIGWVNADSSYNTFIQKWNWGKWLSKKLGAVSFASSNVVYMNLNRKWSKYKDHSVGVVYASHLFEHLTLDSAALFLQEAYRVLQPNGCIRLVMPDLYAHCKAYIADLDAGKTEASQDFLWALNLYKEGPGEKLTILQNVTGTLQGYPFRHKFMYDRLSLTKLLSDYGFRDIHLGAYGESKYISEINDVEGSHLYGGYPNSIYIEALK